MVDLGWLTGLHLLVLKSRGKNIFWTLKYKGLNLGSTGNCLYDPGRFLNSLIISFIRGNHKRVCNSFILRD